MKKTKRIIASILVILVFLCLFLPKVQATNVEVKEGEIGETIDKGDGGIFEKIIAKLIGGIAETVLNLTTSKEFGMGFKNYDELIFAQKSTNISPFDQVQWDTMIYWYNIMASIAGSLILIVVVVIAYKLIIGAYSIEKRMEAKDSLFRLAFGAICISLAPLFVKFLLLINNNLVHIIVGYSNGSLDELLGNNVLSNINTGNAIATAIVIAMFAYLFVKLNIKFIIRQFTILIFTLFTPIVVIMWMLNKRTIGASIWFGQIFVNIFMQFIYAFLFLIYLNFLPQAGGWAISLLWAMMILPIADALSNTLQNLISRIAGVDNEELSNRGVGMASAMGHSVRAISYQFKNPDGDEANNGKGLLYRLFNKTEETEVAKPMETKPMEKTPMIQTPIISQDSKQSRANEKNNIMEGTTKIQNNMQQSSKAQETLKGENTNNSNREIGKVAYNVGKEILNMGMYMAEGRNFDTQSKYSRNNINKTRKEDYKVKNNQENVITNRDGNEEQ